MLHITNGDCAAGVIRAAGVQGEILPWRDVLHEGRVDSRLSLDDLSTLRIQFIAEAGWAPHDEVERSFRERDRRLQSCAQDDEIVLWFEHDLYDQLQLIQVLSWFAAHPDPHPHPKLSLVCEAEYLGAMAPSRAATLFAARRPVGRSMLEAGQRAWHAFGSPDPQSIGLQSRPELPFLAPALQRHLEEYPWVNDDLSRTERQVLDCLAGAPLEFGDLFRRCAQLEEAVFLGDTVLAWHLERMAREGLVVHQGSRWVLKGRTRGKRAPRWLGGVLLDSGAPWRWEPRTRRLGLRA